MGVWSGDQTTGESMTDAGQGIGFLVGRDANLGL